LVIISYTTGLSFALERIGPLAAIITIVFYLLALYLFALPNTPENPFASIYSETLIKTTCQHLLLLVGFDKRFHVKGKLAPRYIGPYKILEHRREMSYKLELPPKLSEFHDVFHVSQLCKFLQTPNKPETFKEIDQDSIDLNHDLTYRERPICILEKDVCLT
jgi:hypothetical protein